MSIHGRIPIDGRPLREIVEEFEILQHFDPAGGYGGVVFEFVNTGPLEEYFYQVFDDESQRFLADGIFVLGCECGEVGCRPLKCHVTVDGNNICGETPPNRIARIVTTRV